MQGVLACLLRGQGVVGLASDVLGVAPLYVTHLDGGEVLASDLDLLNRLDAGERGLPGAAEGARPWAGVQTGAVDTWRVPAGLVAMVGRGGVRFERLVREPDAAPWLRHRPAWMDSADGPTIRKWLTEALQGALAAARRGLGTLVPDAAADDWQAWLLAAAGQPTPLTGGEDAASTARWSLAGTSGLLGSPMWPPAAPRRATERLEWLRSARTAAMTGAPAWPDVDVPEPAARLSEERAAAVWLRHGWTIGLRIAREQEEAAATGGMIVWPQLDPAIVAGVGALGPAVVGAALVAGE